MRNFIQHWAKGFGRLHQQHDPIFEDTEHNGRKEQVDSDKFRLNLGMDIH